MQGATILSWNYFYTMVVSIHAPYAGSDDDVGNYNLPNN